MESVRHIEKQHHGSDVGDQPHPILNLYELCASVVKTSSLLFLLAASALAQTVNIDFFYAPGCPRCDEVTSCVNVVSNRYAPLVAIHTINLSVVSNYEVLVAMEETIGVRKNEPLVVFIGSNALHGAATILKELDAKVAEGVAMGGIERWRPPATVQGKKRVSERFKTFTWLVVAGAGLADGINPCAFATLVLFASLLASYRRSALDILLAALLFCLAVALTYSVLGLVLFSTLRSLMDLHGIRTGVHVVMAGACLILGVLSLLDALRARRQGKEASAILSLPPRFRERIHRTLHDRTGRTIVLSGVFVAGITVTLMEAVCTGQLYIPTLTLMARDAGTRTRAMGMLDLYNIMFVLPLLALSVAAALGVRSMRLLKLLEKDAVAGRIVMAVFFVIVGIALVVAI